MEKEKSFCLRFPDFEDSVVHSWRELRKEDCFCDVTLACEENQQLLVHKVIVSACSPVLGSLLRQNPHQHPLLYLRGVKYEELENILDFMYQGEVNVPQHRLNEFLAIAVDLKIKGLSEDHSQNNQTLVDSKPQSSLDKDDPRPPLKRKKMDCDTGLENSFELSVKEEVNEDMEEENSEFVGSFEDHKQLLTNNPFNILHSCDQCDFTASTRRTVKRHINATHEGIMYHCDQCDHKANRKDILNTHVQAKHSGGESFSCDQCEYVGATKRYLKSHVESKHTGNNFLCDQCEYKSTRKKDLKKHIEIKHEGAFFYCDHCSYKNAYRNNLKQHVEANHEGIYYFCEQCDYKSTNKRMLQQHVDSKHQGIYFHCDQCEYKATQKSNLKRHVEVHHEEVTYTCDKCEYKTKYKNELKKHESKVHEEIMPEDETTQ